jgi:hypothetical protein
MDWPMGHALTISRHWDRDGEVVLLNLLDSMRLCHDGTYEAIKPFQASWMFDSNRRAIPEWEIRTFVSNSRLTYSRVNELRTRDVLKLIEEGIKRGDLVAVRKVDPAVLASRPVDPSVAKLRLIRDIEAKLNGRMTESGRQYRLIRDIDFEKFPERNYYHVVRQDEAKQVLDALAKQPGTSAELAELFVKARDQLTRDWHALTEPDGLILLRRIPVSRAPVANDEPAITPSQFRRLKEGWITIEVQNVREVPWDGTLHLVLAEGGTRDLAVNGDGVVHLENIEPGSVSTSLEIPDSGEKS